MPIWWPRFRWAVWAVLTVLATAALVVLRGLFIQPKGTDRRVVLPALPPAVQQRADAAQEAALVAKATAAVKSEEHKQELAVIAAVPDGHERRKRLANFVREL